MKFRFSAVILGLSLSFVLAGAASSQTEKPGLASLFAGGIVATVHSVQDGDTLTAMIDGRAYRIRLSDIDAPELEHCAGDGSQASCKRKGQPFGVESSNSLRELVLGRRVRLVCFDYDGRYERTVCRVYVGNTDVNLVQVERGLAWFNAKYSKDRAIKKAHDDARLAGIGLWSHSQPASPWVWRDRCWKHGECRYAVGRLL
jgi:micrococcal nuclease